VFVGLESRKDRLVSDRKALTIDAHLAAAHPGRLGKQYRVALVRKFDTLSYEGYFRFAWRNMHKRLGFFRISV